MMAMKTIPPRVRQLNGRLWKSKGVSSFPQRAIGQARQYPMQAAMVPIGLLQVAIVWFLIIILIVTGFTSLQLLGVILSIILNKKKHTVIPSAWCATWSRGLPPSFLSQ